jgi:hypothetical protein
VSDTSNLSARFFQQCTLINALARILKAVIIAVKQIHGDMLKWSLNQNIEYTKTLIDKIKEVEKDLGLPLEYKD